MIPCEIDETLLESKQEIKPNNYWDFVFHEGFYYQKLSRKKIETLYFLKNLSREFGVEFTTRDNFIEWSDKQLNYVENHTCDRCGFQTTSLSRLDTHRGSRNCDYLLKKDEADKRGELFVPDHKKVVMCTVCGKAFKSKYTLATHEKTKAHRICAKNMREGRKIPTKCTVCNKTFKGDSKKITKTFKRHLKESAKCHKLVGKNETTRGEWLNLYQFFNCKFPIVCCLLSN